MTLTLTDMVNKSLMMLTLTNMVNPPGDLVNHETGMVLATRAHARAAKAHRKKMQFVIDLLSLDG